MHPSAPLVLEGRGCRWGWLGLVALKIILKDKRLLVFYFLLKKPRGWGGGDLCGKGMWNGYLGNKPMKSCSAIAITYFFLHLQCHLCSAQSTFVLKFCLGVYSISLISLLHPVSGLGDGGKGMPVGDACEGNELVRNHFFCFPWSHQQKQFSMQMLLWHLVFFSSWS